ncbi:hypothetical protein [Variovorax sp. E3]|uniref:hypothetical protein n=1 Tax=Variovorax sp. E3 TaxID=1914993 RepID=UPI0018DD7BAC|nr:hypothetical protein [Variovorax sp. E3]
MNRQILRDRLSLIIGFIDTDPRGKQTGRDASSRIVGYYDPRTNKTMDAQSRIIGSGNLLASLIR